MERTLVTGGTGFLGSHLVRTLLARGHNVVSFARGEHGHEAQLRSLQGSPGSLESWIGDVRDLDALRAASERATQVIHCAAQKCVPWSETFPEECIKTNVQGSINVQKAADEVGARALLISSDKACKPINTYGASKYLAERIWRGPIIRLGNIWGSTGSVVYWLLKQRGTGVIKITNRKMRRFHVTAQEAVDHILATDGFAIPEMRWYWLEDLARAVDPEAVIIETGVRAGEKLEEDLYESGTQYRDDWRMSVEDLKREIETLCGSGAMVATPR